MTSSRLSSSVPQTRLARSFAPSWLGGLLALAGLVFVPATLHAAASAAAGAGTPEQRYEAERALCLSGLSHQQRETCLREAAAARAEAERGALAQPSQDYLGNALRRCERLPAADRPACEARIRGEGTVRGSVEEGGIYRERRELVPAPVEPPSTQVPAMPAPPATQVPPITPPGMQAPARVAPIPPSPATPVVPPPTHAPGSPAPAVTPGVAPPPATVPGVPPPASTPGIPSLPGPQ
ncbi:MAG TPA: hypothetical protein PK177_13680 [Burkholderiaceae bacterium]|nr:hypothetical protein [Burkholderiaceae bacterium]